MTLTYRLASHQNGLDLPQIAGLFQVEAESCFWGSFGLLVRLAAGDVLPKRVSRKTICFAPLLAASLTHPGQAPVRWAEFKNEI